MRARITYSSPRTTCVRTKRWTTLMRQRFQEGWNTGHSAHQPFRQQPFSSSLLLHKSGQHTVLFFFPPSKMFIRSIAACGAARDKCLKSCQLPLQKILFSNQAGLLQWNRTNHRAFSGTSLSAPHPYFVALSRSIVAHSLSHSPYDDTYACRQVSPCLQRLAITD